MNRIRILIVEDEPIIAMDLMAMIKDLDFITTGVVGSGRQAIQAVENECPDLVLMDISLSGDMDGIEAAKIICEHHDVPIVFVTALSNIELVARAKKCGAFGYVTKPFTRPTIANAIELAIFRHGMEKQLRESEERFRIFAEYTHDWEYWLDPDGKPIYHSPSCLRMTGYSAEDFMARPKLLLEVIHPDDVEMVNEHIRQACTCKLTAGEIDFRMITRHGETRWFNHVCLPVHDDDGRFRGRRVGNRDITDRKQLEFRLEYMAIHDWLTGLPNRTLLLDRLAHAIAGAERNQGRMAVMFIDLDDFKLINDNFGHNVGDLTLKEVANRISTAIRSSDTVARFGGDEFVVVLSEVAELEDARKFALHISQIISAPFMIDDQDIPIQASIGTALFPDDGHSPEELISQADAAMYRVKALAK